MKLDTDNPAVPEEFGIDDELWESYDQYEKELVALEYELKKSDALTRMSETGPSQEVAAVFDLNQLGLSSGRLREDESSEEVLLRNLSDTGVLERALISDKVSISEINVTDDKVRIVAGPFV